MPNKQLVGFSRIALEKGETKNVFFKVSREQLCYWDVETKNWKFDAGKFEFKIVASSGDIRLTQSIVIN